MWHSAVEVAHSDAAIWHFSCCCGPFTGCQVAVACDVDQSGTAMCLWEIWECSAMWQGLGRWTGKMLTRGISGTHLSDMWNPHGWGGPMKCWHVALTCWGGPMRCWHVSHPLFSDSVCVCLGSPVCTQMSLCPQVAPRVALIKSQLLINPFNLFYLLWIYFNSFTYPKIMKFSPKISKFMMIIPVIFNSIFTPASLN
jgi:hypothetical protein